MPRQSSTSPCSPGRNQNWLRYQPPGKDSSAGEARKATRPSASTAQALRSHRRRDDGARCRPRRRAPTPPSSSSCPNRSRSRAVAASPPSWTAVPSAVADDLGVALGAHRRPDQRRRAGRPSARRRPARRPSRARRSRRSGRGTARRAAPRPQRLQERVEPARLLAGRATPADPAVEPPDVGLRVGVVLEEAHAAAHVEQVAHGRAGVPAARRARGRSSTTSRSRSSSPRSARIPATQPTTDLVTDSTAWVRCGPPVGAYPSATRCPSWSTAHASVQVSSRTSPTVDRRAVDAGRLDGEDVVSLGVVRERSHADRHPAGPAGSGAARARARTPTG